MGELDGKVAVITGAGSGMARASTRVFVREGARVLAADIGGREAETAAEVGLQPTGWRVRIHGDALFDLRMPFPVTLDELASFVPAYNANGPVHAIPYVCAAAPGFVTTQDLPHILSGGRLNG